jgi:hypothetical protein
MAGWLTGLLGSINGANGAISRHCLKQIILYEYHLSEYGMQNIYVAAPTSIGRNVALPSPACI